MRNIGAIFMLVGMLLVPVRTVHADTCYPIPGQNEMSCVRVCAEGDPTCKSGYRTCKNASASIECGCAGKSDPVAGMCRPLKAM